MSRKTGIILQPGNYINFINSCMLMPCSSVSGGIAPTARSALKTGTMSGNNWGYGKENGKMFLHPACSCTVEVFNYRLTKLFNTKCFCYFVLHCLFDPEECEC